MRKEADFPVTVMTNNSGAKLAQVTAVALLILANNALAQEAAQDNFSWSIGASGEYSDNYFRVQDGESSEWFYSAFSRFSGQGSGERWQAATAADLAYRAFANKTIDTQLQGGFTARIQYELIEDYLQIFAEDYYGQVRPMRSIDNPQADLDQEDINSLRLGTTLTVPLGKKTSFFATAAWTENLQAGLEGDQIRKESTAGFTQALSPLSFITLSAGRVRVEFESLAAGNNYDIDEASLGFSANYSRTDIQLDVGKTRVISEGGADSEGLLLRLDVIRKIGMRLQWHVAAGTEYSDSAQAFVQQQQLGGVDQEPLAIGLISDPFKSDYAFLDVSYDGQRTDIATQYTWRRQRYDFQTQPNSLLHQFDVRYTRQFSSKFDLNLSGLYERSRSDVAGAEWLYDAELRLGATLRVMRSIVVQPYVAHYKGTAAGYNYDENRVGISISYAPAP